MRFIKGFVVLLTAFSFSSCGNKTAQIWTDRPEFAMYGEFFNTAQNQYKVTVKYYDYPAAELEKTKNCPDIIVGSWLKNASTGANFKSLDNFFGAKKLSRNVFYQRLLAVGRIERNQYILPVSFNVPALIFSRNKEENFSNPFTIDFDEIKSLSKNFNIERSGDYTRMGFSPLWNDDFLFTAAKLFGASFTEAAPLAWDNAALDRSMNFVYDWTHEINTNNQAEEDFTFKYFFEPPAKLIQSGRILFSYMESNVIFTLPEESKNNLDFRWIAEQNRIPITEDAVFLGVPKNAKSTKAAEAFVLWFFKVDTQRRIMEECKTNRMNESVFGICGGFSAINSVTEQIFPKFYPDLLGRMPTSEFLTYPSILPANWITLKERVVLPYLHDRARKRNETNTLEKRIVDWLRMNK
ncbi:MAG: hypothetical protein LBH44_10820 [Treponema sp.]|jgi:hypothetical protein|nr:hypothetical protein [Treponema sp.]